MLTPWLIVTMQSWFTRTKTQRPCKKACNPALTYFCLLHKERERLIQCAQNPILSYFDWKERGSHSSTCTCPMFSATDSKQKYIQIRGLRLLEQMTASVIVKVQENGFWDHSALFIRLEGAAHTSCILPPKSRVRSHFPFATETNVWSSSKTNRLLSTRFKGYAFARV